MPDAESITRRFRRNDGKRGQATVEYVVTAGVMLSLIVLMSAFLYVFKEYGTRIIDLIASEYP